MGEVRPCASNAVFSAKSSTAPTKISTDVRICGPAESFGWRAKETTDRVGAATEKDTLPPLSGAFLKEQSLAPGPSMEDLFSPRKTPRQGNLRKAKPLSNLAGTTSE